jgi:alpha-galactosidase
MLSSMEASLGIGANIAKWTPARFCHGQAADRGVPPVQKTIVQGDLYRLISPLNGSEFSATETVNHDRSQSVVFAFIHSTQEGRGFPILKLRGLDPGARYAVSSIEGKLRDGAPAVASGAWWMNHGIEMGEDFRGDFHAAAFRLDKK